MTVEPMCIVCNGIYTSPLLQIKWQRPLGGKTYGTIKNYNEHFKAMTKYENELVNSMVLRGSVMLRGGSFYHYENTTKQNLLLAISANNTIDQEPSLSCFKCSKLMVLPALCVYSNISACVHNIERKKKPKSNHWTFLAKYCISKIGEMLRPSNPIFPPTCYGYLTHW